MENRTLWCVSILCACVLSLTLLAPRVHAEHDAVEAAPTAVPDTAAVATNAASPVPVSVIRIAKVTDMPTAWVAGTQLYIKGNVDMSDEQIESLRVALNNDHKYWTVVVAQNVDDEKFSSQLVKEKSGLDAALYAVTTALPQQPRFQAHLVEDSFATGMILFISLTPAAVVPHVSSYYLHYVDSRSGFGEPARKDFTQDLISGGDVRQTALKVMRALDGYFNEEYSKKAGSKGVLFLVAAGVLVAVLVTVMIRSSLENDRKFRASMLKSVRRILAERRNEIQALIRRRNTLFRDMEEVESISDSATKVDAKRAVTDLASLCLKYVAAEEIVQMYAQKKIPIAARTENEKLKEEERVYAALMAHNCSFNLKWKFGPELLAGLFGNELAFGERRVLLSVRQLLWVQEEELNISFPEASLNQLLHQIADTVRRADVALDGLEAKKGAEAREVFPAAMAK